MYYNSQRYHEILIDLKAKLDEVDQFNKIAETIDISSYRKKLKEIEKKLSQNPAFNEVHSFESEDMQQSFAAFSYTPAIKELNELNDKFKKEIEPYYKIKWLSSSIKEITQNSTKDKNSILEIQKNAKELLKIIEENNLIQGDLIENDKKRQKIISEAYLMIYITILYETLFNRSDILDLIIATENGMIVENINYLIKKGASSASQNSPDFANYYTAYSQDKFTEKGFGDNFLEKEFIEKLAKEIVGNESEEYLLEGKKELRNLLNKATNLQKQILILKDEEKGISKEIRSLERTKTALEIRVWLTEGKKYLILTPLVLTLVGSTIGLGASAKIKEYATITETIDIDTGERVGDVSVTYDEHETTYVVSITEYGPWKKNPTGSGYIRSAKTYTYKPNENMSEDDKITREDLFDENTELKYTFYEAKQELEPSDSMENDKIYITQTYQNKEDTKPSKKYVLPGAGAGIGVGLSIDAIYTIFHLSNLYELKRKLNKLHDSLESAKEKQKSIKKRRRDLKTIQQELKNDYEKFIEEYGLNFDRNMSASIKNILTSLDKEEEKGKILIRK